VELNLGLGGVPISAWGGVSELCANCGVGFVWCYLLCGFGFDMVARVGVVVIVWGGSCCGGDCVGDGWEKK
jgi:hypothetical protein